MVGDVLACPPEVGNVQRMVGPAGPLRSLCPQCEGHPPYIGHGEPFCRPATAHAGGPASGFSTAASTSAPASRGGGPASASAGTLASTGICIDTGTGSPHTARHALESAISASAHAPF